MADINTDKSYQLVDQKYEDSKMAIEKRFKDFNEFEELYWGYLSGTGWKSTVFDPETFEKVERVTSHLTSTNPRGKFYPREDSDDLKARIADEVFKYQWTLPEANMHSKIVRMAKSSSLFGTSFGLLTWKFERKLKAIVENGKEVNKFQTTYDSWYFQDLYPYDCFPDPSATSIQDMRYFIVREYTTLSELEDSNTKVNGVNRYINLKLLKEALKEDAKANASQDQNRGRVDRLKGTDQGEVKGRVLILRYFDKERWITIAPDFHLKIEDRACPYTHGELPIHVLVDHEYPNQLWGIGEIEPIKKLQKGLNSVLNQRLDNVRLQLNAPFKARAGSKYAHTWISKPGQIWQVEDQGDIEYMPIPDATGGTFIQTTNYFKDAMSRSLGHMDFLTRNETKKDKTATEIMASQGEQNARMKAKEANMDAFIARLSVQAMQLNSQYLSSGKIVRIIGKDTVKELQKRMADEQGEPTMATYKGQEQPKLNVSPSGEFATLLLEPDDLSGTLDFIPETGSTTMVDPTPEINNLMNAITTGLKLNQALAEEGVKIKYKDLMEKLFTKLGVKNIDEIFDTTTTPQMQQIGSEMEMIKQAMTQIMTPEQRAMMAQMLQGQQPQQPMAQPMGQNLNNPMMQ